MNRGNRSAWVLAVGVACVALLVLLAAQLVAMAEESMGGITGRVTIDPDGGPIVGARVRATDPDTGEWRAEATTDEEGRYTLDLPSGTYVVGTCAVCSGLNYVDEYYDNALVHQEATPVTVVAPGIVGLPDFGLQPGGTISGTVTDGDDLPLADVNVTAQPVDGSSGWGNAPSDATGRYTLTGLAAGEYRVDARKEGYVTQFYDHTLDWGSAMPVLVVEDEITPDIDFHLQAGGTIRGTVTDASTGLPITSTQINAMPTGGAPWVPADYQIDSHGVYTLAGLPAGTYKVEANATGYDRQFYDGQKDWEFGDEVEVTAPGVTGNIDFALQKERGATLYGYVVLPDGAPAPWAHVEATSFDYMTHKGEPTDEQGLFRIGGMITGTWRLRAHPPGDPEYQDFSESEEILVEVSGAEAITLTTPLTLTGVNLLGRAMMPDGTPARWTGVDVHTVDFSFHQGTGTDDSGYFRMGGLAPGNYVLELHVPWGTSGIVSPPPMEFSIEVGQVRDLGNITFTQAVKHIVGAVVRSDAGTGVPDVEVNASRRGTGGWAWTRTDGSGDFELDVAPGTWEVMIHPAPGGDTADWVYDGHPQTVTFSDDPAEVETKIITFTVQSPDAYVVGAVKAPDGGQLHHDRVWIDVRDDRGYGNHAPLSPGGLFTVPVSAGTYKLWIGIDEQTYPYWSSPQLPPFNVATGEINNRGDIYLVEKTSAIKGRVTSSSDPSGIAELRLHAWQHEGGWASTTTGSDGSYVMSVLSGTWEINVEPPYTSTYITGEPPRRVTVGDNETIADVDFILQESAGTIQGRLLDTDGNLLTDVDGWAYAREPRAPEPVAGAPVNRGEFSLNVPSGTYNVGIHLPPGSGYSPPEEQEVGPLASAQLVARAKTPAEVALLDMSKREQRVTVLASSSVPITLTLLPNDSLIVGGFFTDDDKTVPAVGLNGEVFAMGGMGGAWQPAPIDPTDGSFEIRVAAGTWNLGYWLDTSDYVNSPPPDTRVTISSEQVFTFNFTVVASDASIQGVILDPDGNPLLHAWAHAHRQRSASSAAIDTGDESKPPDGGFSIGVPSGGTYEVGAHCPEDWGYIQADFQMVTPTVGSTDPITLQFKASNGTINGTVYYHDEAGNPVYGPWAWVWAWSDDGQHTGAPTDFQGGYQLNVVTGTTWHVGACYQAEEGSLFYETSAPTDIVMTTTHASADLTIYLADTALPPAAADTFDPSVGWTNSLADGTQIEIPAGAMPTTDTVRISVTPLVEELQNTLTARPFGYGYAIAAFENSTGNQIVQNFNSNVLITFYYTDAELEKRGVDEDNLSPAYFSTTTNSWTKVESFSVDKAANKVTVQINHFSTWALTAPASREGYVPPEPEEHRVCLPLVVEASS